MFATYLAQIRNNPRLRWGIWLIFGILWLYAILVLRDQLGEKTEQYAGTLKKLARIQAEASQKDWLERVGPAKILRVQVESRLWQAGTSGLAQAAFQDWLNQMFLQAAVSRPTITLSALDEKVPEKADEAEKAGATAAVPDDLWKVKAKLEFDFNPPAFLSLMTLIGGYEKKTVFESLVIRKEPFPRVEAVVVAYFQKQKNPGNSGKPGP